jgi:hypothetical protein
MAETASIRDSNRVRRFFSILLVPFVLLALPIVWLLSKLKRLLGSLLSKLKRPAAWLLSKPPLRRLLSVVKWMVDLLLSMRPRSRLVLSVIVALTAVVVLVLTKTEQGHDLVQLARDEGSGSALFLWLSAAMALVVFLVFHVASDVPTEKILELSPKWAGLTGVISIGLAFFAGSLGESWGESLWLFFSVWPIGAMIGALVAMLILTVFERQQMSASYIVGGVAFVCLLVIAYFPGKFGTTLGSSFSLITLISLWIVFFFALSRTGYRAQATFLCVVALSWLAFGAIKAGVVLIRGYPFLDYVRPEARPNSGPLPTPKAAYQAWLKNHTEAKPQNQTEPKPQLVLVAAAGGGIRASYWTSLTLTRLMDRVPKLRAKLFAASGVSGGSLGLGIFYGLLSASASNDPLKCAAVGRPFEPCVRAFHEHDFLAAMLGATLAGLPANAFVPIFPYRNEALELGWEHAWRNTVGEQSPVADVFSASMASLWRDGGSHPLLLLNATSAIRGERVMSADVRITDPNWIRLRTPCRLNLVEEINPPLSAAIGTSARFPLVSDWGWLRQPKAAGCGRLEGIADGGFYDNYGAVTILDLLDWLADKDGGGVNLRGIKLVVIQITSDPSKEMRCLFNRLDADPKPIDARCSPPPPPSPVTPATPPIATNAFQKTVIEAIAPFRKMDELLTGLPDRYRNSSVGFGEPSTIDVAMQARSVNGIGAAEQLRERTCLLGGSYYHFAMTGAERVPLGWTLSTTSQARLSALLDTEPGLSRLNRLVNELNTGVGRGQCENDSSSATP